MRTEVHVSTYVLSAVILKSTRVLVCTLHMDGCDIEKLKILF